MLLGRFLLVCIRFHKKQRVFLAIELLNITTLCGKQLTRKDLHNIQTSSKRSALNEEDNILEELETILDCDPACSIKVHTDTNNELEAIFIQTSAMK